MFFKKCVTTAGKWRGKSAGKPRLMQKVGGKCLLFDAYGNRSTNKAPFGLLAVIEIFPSEMNFAREYGGDALIVKLKEAGYYPYSDLERDPVA